MFSKDDDDTGFALGLVFGLIFLVVSTVVGTVVYQKIKAGKAPQPVVAAAAPAVPVMPSPVAAEADGASIKVENGVVKFYFASGKSDIAQGSQQALSAILASAKTKRKVGISGFVDPSGDPQKNAELAKKRAFMVRDLLISYGVAESQIVLVRPNDIKAGATSAAEGRRVEVFMI
jgi:outer membrane protein OmpA-like peptidoglycan-associated protein